VGAGIWIKEATDVVAAMDPVGPVFWADIRLEEERAALMPPLTMSSSWIGMERMGDGGFRQSGGRGM
jgi:hypothetical protein